ncbi:hypothetical protein [Dactylosporangium sp. NPDC049140]|uniref:hypothetical protein n=1 Tax=Dactylosporangium sp. NPDC049140 TaxID=3155647 RepID=UPI0034024EBE
MRDWIGTGLSLAGFAVAVVAATQWVRSRAWRPARQSGRAWSRSSVATFAALLLLESGVLLRPHAWPLTALHVAVSTIAVAGLFMWYLDRRHTRP